MVALLELDYRTVQYTTLEQLHFQVKESKALKDIGMARGIKKIPCEKETYALLEPFKVLLLNMG